MKIGRIAYLNVLPFYHGLPEDRWGPYVEGSPRYLGECARKGQLDAAPLALVDTFDLGATFEPLGNFGIACKGAVGSVILFSHRPFHRLGGCRILFTGDSVTSVVLAQQLLDRAGNTGYRIERGDDPTGFDAYLAIGDRALRTVCTSGFEFRTDLSQRWLQSTGLPFVFARWVVRRSIPEPEKSDLARDLTRSLAMPPPVTEPNSAGLNAAEAKAYLSNMIYQFDDDCLKAIATFKAQWHVFA